MKKIAIIGGGAAGMMAGIAASTKDCIVDIYEKNEKLGKKVYITGKGRCNLTNDCEDEDFFKNVVSNPKFLFSCYKNIPSSFICDFFEKNGLKLKTERGNRVFPLSDKSSDVIKTLEKILIKQNVNIFLNTVVDKLLYDEEKILGVLINGEKRFYDSVIVCTGGLSYPTTGSDGDGYIFAKSCKHTIVETKPALSSIILKGNDFASLQGLSLKNVKITCLENGKKIFSDFGEMIFTHFGISGPIVLTASSYINRKNMEKLSIVIDLKPALDFETLDSRLIREFKANKLSNIANVMRLLVPSSMINLILARANINGDVKCSNITKEQRTRLLESLKNLSFNIESISGIEQAIITAGGVSTKEINPKTMESKLKKGLFFAGEVLDVDALTGGFNLQIAFSTGYTAGIYA